MKHQVPLLQQLFNQIEDHTLNIEGDEVYCFYPTRAHATKGETCTISGIELLAQYATYNDNVNSGDLIYWQ